MGWKRRVEERWSERWRGWRRLHDPVRPFILRNFLGYRIRGGIKRTARASSIATCYIRWWRVIGVHVRIVAACTRRSGIIVLGTFALFLSNTMDTRTRVDRIVDSPVRTFTPICQRSGHFFETWVQREVVTDGILEDKRR